MHQEIASFMTYNKLNCVCWRTKCCWEIMFSFRPVSRVWQTRSPLLSQKRDVWKKGRHSQQNLAGDLPTLRVRNSGLSFLQIHLQLMRTTIQPKLNATAPHSGRPCPEHVWEHLCEKMFSSTTWSKIFYLYFLIKCPTQPMVIFWPVKQDVVRWLYALFCFTKCFDG